jgi:REP-associated tyrosine transposase
MARPLRIQEPGLTYHVTARGNARMVIFANAGERRRFLRLFANLCERHTIDCYAYVLMSNHYHLVIKTHDANLSRTIQTLNGDYARWWNRQHGRVGHLFQGRFDSPVVQDGHYLLTVCRYVVRNPVAAGMVVSPEDWPWSSYRATAGLVRAPAFLKPDAVLRLFDADSRRAALRRYRAYVSAADAAADRLPKTSVIGDDDYVERFSDHFIAASREVPSRQRTTRPTLHMLLAEAVTRDRRNAQAAEAVRFGYSVVSVARFLGVNPSTIYRAVRADEASHREAETGTLAPDCGKTPICKL